MLLFLILTKLNKNEKLNELLQRTKELDLYTYEFINGYYQFKFLKNTNKPDTETPMLNFINYYKLNYMKKDYLYAINISVYHLLYSEFKRFFSEPQFGFLLRV